MQNLRRRNRPAQPFEVVEEPSAPNQQHVRTRVLAYCTVHPEESPSPSHCDPPSTLWGRSPVRTVRPILPSQRMSVASPARRCARDLHRISWAGQTHPTAPASE